MSIYGDMNYYGNLLRTEGSRIYYEYGCSLDNMTGILMIDTGEETWNNEKFPDGIEVETVMFRRFANKVLGECIRGEIREKVSREIGWENITIPELPWRSSKEFRKQSWKKIKGKYSLIINTDVNPPVLWNYTISAVKDRTWIWDEDLFEKDSVILGGNPFTWQFVRGNVGNCLKLQNDSGTGRFVLCRKSEGLSMGSYEAEWYGFEVKSMRHLMDLYIEPSFHSAICIQFHEMADCSYRAFYNYQPDWKKVVDVLKAYARERNMDPSTKAMVAIDIAATAGVFKPLAPVSSYGLREDEKRCVEELYENELPATDEHIIGLDGHSYTLRIFKDGEEKCYRTWCVTPVSWSALRNLVNTVVERLGLDPGGYGAYVKKNT